MKVYGRGPNDTNVNRNIKKIYAGSTQGYLKKYNTIIEVVSHTRYIDIELVYVWEIKKNLGTDLILKLKI